MGLWLYLHFPSLHLDGLLAQNENNLHQVVAVVDGRQSRVVQCNALAEQVGINIGMGLGTAASLCSALQVFAYDIEIEHNRLIELADWLYLLTSDISLYPPNGLLLNVTNMLTLYSDLNNYWLHLQHHLAEVGVQYQFSTGYSPLSAQLLAKSANNAVSECRHDMHKRLCAQPLSATELPHKTIEGLSRVGVDNLNALLQIPVKELARRFDIGVVNYVGRLTGQFKHPVTVYHPKVLFKRQITLLYEIENTQWLRKPLQVLLTQLEQFLALRDQLAYELTLTLHQRDESCLCVSLTSAQGDYRAEAWQRLSALRLESVALSAPVVGLTLDIVRQGERGSDETDLFDGKQGSMTSLALLSMLQAKLGQDAVKGVCAVNDPRPELESHYCVPFTPESMVGVELKALRPSFLLPTATRLKEKVSVVHGPERIATGWWDDNPIVRDYFIARSEQGSWLWIFRDQQQHWYLHGIFS
ncbi:Y-family DNA polymerase [Thaumasiovibrio sp. DFM-14]|uniref:Y-family DNA polymerase n=1 Tax=Thaumasiovibrio sp. DFM-14 TaxID=3384792 RepID=UPI0039A013F6